MRAKIKKLVCSLVGSLLLASCLSTSEGGGLDLTALHNHLHPSSQAFSDAALVVEVDNPELAKELREIESLVLIVDSVVETYIAGGQEELTTLEAIDKFLVETQPLLQKYSDNINIQLSLIAVRQILSQVRLAVQQ